MSFTLSQQRLVLKREWFQDHSLPHYDVTIRKRESARMAGAVGDSAVNMIKRFRKGQKCHTEKS